MTKNKNGSWEHWCRPAITDLRRLKLEDLKFKATLGKTARPQFNKQNTCQMFPDISLVKFFKTLMSCGMTEIKTEQGWGAAQWQRTCLVFISSEFDVPHWKTKTKNPGNIKGQVPVETNSCRAGAHAPAGSPIPCWGEWHKRPLYHPPHLS